MWRTVKPTRFDRVASIAGVDYGFDVWGETMALFFAVADVLDMADIEGDLTPGLFEKWGYTRGAASTVPALETVAERYETFNEGEFIGDFTYETVQLAYALHNEDISVEDLIYVGNVLDRYSRLLDAAGKSY
jgi:hypothetical protein